MFWHSTTHLVRTLSGSMNLSRRAQCYATIAVWVRLMRADYGTRYISIYVPFHSWLEIMTTCSFRLFICLSPSVVRSPSCALHTKLDPPLSNACLRRCARLRLEDFLKTVASHVCGRHRDDRTINYKLSWRRRGEGSTSSPIDGWSAPRHFHCSVLQLLRAYCAPGRGCHPTAAPLPAGLAGCHRVRFSNSRIQSSLIFCSLRKSFGTVIYYC